MLKPKNFKLSLNRKFPLILKLRLTSHIKRKKKNKKKQLQFKRIQFFLDLKNYKGIRLKKRLPVRGQRTRTNAVSCKK